MADPSTWKPGNPGDVQPWRSRRRTSQFPAGTPCGRYEEWTGNTSPTDYGYPVGTCPMCGHHRDEHPEPQDVVPAGGGHH